MEHTDNHFQCKIEIKQEDIFLCEPEFGNIKNDSEEIARSCFIAEVKDEVDEHNPLATSYDIHVEVDALKREHEHCHMSDGGSEKWNAVVNQGKILHEYFFYLIKAVIKVTSRYIFILAVTPRRAYR